MLGISSHPYFAHTDIKRMEHWRLVKLVRDVVYGVDLESLYPDLRGPVRFHLTAQGRHKRHEAAVMRVVDDRMPACLENITKALLVGHFRLCVARQPSSTIYTLNVEEGLLPSVASAMSSVPQGDEIQSDVVMESFLASALCSIHRQPLVCFRVLRASAGAWHVVSMSRASGRRLRESDMIVSLHDLQVVGERRFVACGTSLAPNGVGVLRDSLFNLPLDQLEQSLCRWQV